MNSKPPAKKATAKKTAAKKAPSKTEAKKAAPAKKTPAKKAVQTAPASSKAPSKSEAKKAPVKEAPAKKAAVKTAAKKAAVKQAPVKTAAKKAPAKKAPAKKAPSSVPVKKAAPGKVESPFDDRFLESQKALLIEERRRLLHDADSLTAEATSLAELREPGDVQFDEESGEGDTLAVERERDLALSAQFRHQVEEIDLAMAKFDKGTYGICEISGTPIPKERLKAIPWARERVEHKVGGFGRR